MKLTGDPVIDNVATYALQRLGLLRPNPTKQDGNRPRRQGDPSTFLRRIAKAESGLLYVIGRPGTGKTALCFVLAQALARPTYVVGVPQNLLPPYAKSITLDQLESVPAHSTVIIDDVGLFAGSRDFYKPTTASLHKMMALSRHKGLVVISNSQTSSIADKQLLWADALFFKPLSSMYGEFERPFVRKLAGEANEAFSGMGEGEIRRHVYVVSEMYNFRGMLTYPKPFGFTEALSRNKAAV